MATLLDASAPKENANPTVLSVTSRRVGSRPPPLGSEFVARYNLSRYEEFLRDKANRTHDEEKNSDNGYFSEDDEQGVKGAIVSSPLFSNSAERSAHIALSEAAKSSSPSHGRNFVGVLRTAGFVLPLPSDGSLGTFVGSGTSKTAGGALCRPAFVPANQSARAIEKDSYSFPQINSKQHPRTRDEIDADEVFEIIRNIRDPEHPLTLEQLGVVRRDHVAVIDAVSAGEGSDKDKAFTCGEKTPNHRLAFSTVDVRFTPTIPHCSMATLIGLSLRVKLLRSLPKRFKVTVRIEPGTHASETAVNRQLDDKERVCAALENDHLRGVVDKCIADGMRGNMS